MKNNKSKKVCSICKKVIDYPTVSIKDNKNIICSQCGLAEVLSEIFSFNEKLKNGSLQNSNNNVIKNI